MSDTSVSAASFARFRVVHETRYTYQSMVTLSQQYLHLTPRSFIYQQIESHRIVIAPHEEDGSEGHDYFGNMTRHIAITVPHKTLSVHAESIVVLKPRFTLTRIQGTLSWETLRDSVRQDKSEAALDACRYLYASPHVHLSPDLGDYGRISFTPGRPLLDAALNLTQRIFDDFEFDDKATEISTPLDEVLKGRRGVCQDFAQLMIGCMRALGLPARYVSGYILTHPPAGQPRMIGADASHAWVSIFCPDFGWIDFDPTNRCLVQSEHITLGWGRDFSDVTPMRGIVLGGGEQTLDVEVTVTPLPHI
ncbi:transglutaminase family protein [Glaciimonas immobilis]|uniref:Transglutaminase-like putative cysteine protease n=1 Tax=Glaciimonas immobilis TaxID=728004 RepID=A0A840RVE6_9BURK|nr:transglutaminase family protein [Glaciimonas immobilis]KAF3998697.1 transglutaminase family protein [Glaciimonas immobilis]MBB5201573.1 transglutaminase-like putative cysteine protease [Glaciimonas immobilis]